MNEPSHAKALETGKEFTMECPSWEKPGSTHSPDEMIKNGNTDLPSMRAHKFLFAKGTFPVFLWYRIV